MANEAVSRFAEGHKRQRQVDEGLTEMFALDYWIHSPDLHSLSPEVLEKGVSAAWLLGRNSGN